MYPSQHGAWTLGTKLLEEQKTVGDEFLENRVLDLIGREGPFPAFDFYGGISFT